MATSLATQLQKLAVPQTTALQRDKTRASILFDRKVAASIDRETFYDIGISGLKELEKYNSDFAIFENSLFSAVSRDVERSVENKNVNAILDKNVRRFLCMLSPYFVIKPAHKALEWLVHRFSIHEYNREDFLKLILPYHETNIFVKCVQLFNVRDQNDGLNWLRPLQKNGVSLPKSTLFGHCVSNVGFLKMIGQMTIEAVKENGAHATALTTLFSFYCTTVIGTLENSKTVSEPQISAILPSLLHGFSSDVPDYTASSYMIIAQLLRKTKLSEKLLKQIVYKIAKHDTHLRLEATTLLLLIYQMQHDVFNTVSDKAMKYLIEKKWFIGNLNKLIANGAYTVPLLIPVLTSAMQKITNGDYRVFINKLIGEVRVGDKEAKILINVVLENCYKSDGNDDKETIDDINEWYGAVLKRLETQYPNAFDIIVKKVMSSKKMQNHRQALRCILYIVMSTNKNQGNIDVFEKLYHPNAVFRAEAIQYLAENYDNLLSKDIDMLQGIIEERLLDDDVNVVNSVFMLNQQRLVELLGANKFSDALIKLILKHGNDEMWLKIVNLALKMLCNEKSIPSSKIFLVVLPYIFPVTDKELKVSLSLLNTHYASKCPLLTKLNKNFISNMTYSEFCEYIVKMLRSSDFEPEFLFEALGNVCTLETVHKYIFSMLLSYSVKGKKCSIKVLDTLTCYLNSCTISNIKNNSSINSVPVIDCMSLAKEGKLPIQGMLNCLKSVLDNNNIVPQSKWIDFSSSDLSVKFITKFYILILKGCSTKSNTSKLYSLLMKYFVSYFYHSYKNKIEFFANFLTVYDDNLIPPIVQLRSILGLKSLLEQAKEPLSWTVDLDSEIIVPAVLIGLSNPVDEIRHTSVDVLAIIANCICVKSLNTYQPLLQKLLKQKQEIAMSCDQISLILFNILSDCNSQNLKYKPILEKLIGISCDVNIPFRVTSNLLNILQHITNNDIMLSTSRLGIHILKSFNDVNKELSYHASPAFYSIIERVNKTDVKKINLESPIWELISLSLKQDALEIEYEVGKYSSPSVLMLNQISNKFFDDLNFDIKYQVVKLLAELITNTENADVVYAANKVIKRINLDAKLVIDGITLMKDAKSSKAVSNQKKSRRSSIIPTVDILDTKEWREGITYLEFIQDKKKLVNTKLLLPVLFGMLKKCLDFDEQSAVEYPKQLLLSLILHCCEKIQSDSEPLPENVFNMDLVVQCIRASQNPQTHYHALLVLAHTATFIPDQVLHNIMAIFTFMGSSVLRHDDAYSFQIISKVLDTVIPILVTSKDETNIANVLRVFVDVILDVPEHRKMPLFIQLLKTLGVEDCLWLFLILVFEAHVVHGIEKPKILKQRSDLFESLPKRLDIASNIVLEFNADIIIKTCIKLMQFLKTLPVEKEENATNAENSIYNIKQSSPKQFRHFKYTLVTFLSNLLSSKQLVNQMAILSTEEAQLMEPLFKDLIVNTLTYVQATSKIVDNSVGSPQAQYWKVIMHHSYDILDSINALLTSEMFLLVVRGLLSHNILTVRRKIMELLNQKLQYQPSFFSSKDGDIENLFALIPSLLNFIKTIDETLEPEHELNQQTALLSLKLLVKLLTPDNPEKFVPILDFITNLIKSGKAQGNILASLVLCLAELCANLRAHAIPGLVKFMPALLKVLRAQRNQDTPSLLLTCIIIAIQKIVESLPLFLSPYLEKLLTELCYLSAAWSQDENNPKLKPFMSKLRNIRSHIGKNIPPRILIPVISVSYETLLKKNQYDAIGPLMNILGNSLGGVRGTELTNLLPDLNKFFLMALQFRTDNEDIDMKQVDIIEGHLISALTSLVLKLSETAFRPFYYKLYDWAVRSDSKTDRVITFYRISYGISESLKGLFVLFAGHFINNAAQLLNECNSIKTETLYFENEPKNLLLIENIFKTLRSVFLYDSQNFIDKDRFETLMQPMVDQLENTVDLENLPTRAKELIIPCISQFAIATADDALWKQLNYQILLKARHNLPEIRLIALNCLCEFAHVLKEDFLPLLPETIPFLAELLEDEDEAVESACQKAVQGLEKVLGEPLQKYF